MATITKPIILDETGQAIVSAIQGISTGAVSSVNGKTGTVVLTASDVGAPTAANGTLTGTTTAENITVSGDLTADQLDVETSITVPTPLSDYEASTKKYVDDEIDNLSDIIPTKTSDLQNDGDGTNPFLTQHQSLSAYRTAANQDTIDATKQDTLIAGTNITIAPDGKTISATGTAYTAGDGIDITDNSVSVKVGTGLFFDSNDAVILNAATQSTLAEVATKSTVTGTNDGTNWQTITIDGTTKAIPVGGGGGAEPDNMTIVLDSNNKLKTTLGGGIYTSATHVLKGTSTQLAAQTSGDWKVWPNFYNLLAYNKPCEIQLDYKVVATQQTKTTTIQIANVPYSANNQHIALSDPDNVLVEWNTWPTQTFCRFVLSTDDGASTYELLEMRIYQDTYVVAKIPNDCINYDNDTISTNSVGNLVANVGLAASNTSSSWVLGQTAYGAGQNALAVGSSAYAGNQSIGLGSNASAGNGYNTAIGRNSKVPTGYQNAQALGPYCEVQQNGQTAIGIANTIVNNKAIVFGIGSNASNRLNGMTLDWSGNLEILGNVNAANIPTAPTSDGTYKLQCVVADGVASYSWVSA